MANPVQSPEAERVTTPQKRPRSFLAELPVLLLIALVLSLLIRTFVVQGFWIPSQSMLPTLTPGDRVLVNRFIYDLRQPQRGEIVVLDAAYADLGQDYIKRIVGLPGEEIATRDGVIEIDGEPLPEALAASGGYLGTRDLEDFGPVKIQPGHYFVMGDNRTNSDDSRGSLGQVPEEAIIGRAFMAVWPVTDIEMLPRPIY